MGSTAGERIGASAFDPGCRWDSMKPRALVCEGDAALRAVVGDLLTAHGWVASEACTATDVIDLATTLHPDLVVLDIEFAGLSCLESIPRVRAVWPEARVVAISASGQALELCLRVGAYAVVTTANLAHLNDVLAGVELLEAA